jgi:uncharacterized protein (DUF934 family)
MDKLNFSETTISASQWYRLRQQGENDDLDSGVMVVGADSPLEFLAGPLNHLRRIVVTSADFNDGRFFSIGRQIRLRGYRGRLTVVGNVLSDQYTALRSCGFDDALILDNFAPGQVIALDNALALAAEDDPVTQNQEPHTLAGNSQ